MSVWTDDLDDLAGVNASSGLRIEDGDASLLDVNFVPQGWEKKGIAVPNGTEPDYDRSWTMQPYVLKEGDEYKMWYTGYNSTAYHIMYATSTDSIDWIKHGPVFGPEYDLVNDLWLTAVPSILKDGNGYKMYYSGADVADRNYFNMYMATSPDGINWTDQGMILGKGDNGTTENMGVMNGKVIKTPDDIYRMAYTGYDGLTWKLHMATSTDGINWVRKGVILDNGPAGSDDYEKLTEPFIVYHHDTYFLWYTGYPIIGKTVICFATSLDGENWTKQGKVLDSSLDSDSKRVGGANVLIDDDGLVKLWYYGSDGFYYNIHYATKSQHSPYYLTKGELMSDVISIPENKAWASLNISKTDIDADNVITVSVLDARTGETIDDLLNLTYEDIDLTDINFLDHPDIQLLARFKSDGDDTPILHSWDIVMKDDVKEYPIIQAKAGEAVSFNCTSFLDGQGVSNCSWTFEYNRSTVILYGPTADFMFWTPGNYSVIMEMTASQGDMVRSKVLVDVTENGTNNGVLDYVWLLAVVAALAMVVVFLLIRARRPGTSGEEDMIKDPAIPDELPIDIMESIEQRYAEGSISEDTYLKLKDKYSKEGSL